MEKPRICIIAAITDERGLGKDNHLLVHVPGDLPRFKKITSGHPVIMGRKTFESIGKALPGRTNIVITHNLSYQAEGCIVLNSLEDALQLATEAEQDLLQPVILGKQSQQPLTPNPLPKGEGDQSEDFHMEIFILGGGEIFKLAMSLVDRLYLTVIHKNFPADTFFPDYSNFTKVLEEEEHTTADFSYTFLTLEK